MPQAGPLSAALLLLLLTACASQPTPLPDESDWQARSAALRELTRWRADGKLALRTPDRSESATLSWRQTGVISRLQLSGPLGTAATSLYSDGQSLEIRQGDSVNSWDLNDPAVLQQQTGWELPLTALPDWIRGLPAPDLAVQDLQLTPDTALLSSLEQDNWSIRYESYGQFGDFTLPTRLAIQRGTTSVRLIIRNWQVSFE